MRFVVVPDAITVTRLMKTLLFGISATDPATFAGMAGLLVVLALFACSPRPELPTLFPVPNASLIDETGKPVQLDSMKGSVTVYDFIFTNCAATCPIMTNNMRALTPLVDKDAAVRFVSITVDPTRDTPAVLASYAKRVRNDPRWTFLTAGPADAAAFMAQFGILVERDAADEVQITHNLRTAVIGADGRLKTVHTGNRWLPDELVADLAATPAPAN